MAHLKYNSYPGFGEEVAESAHYSTAVRIPPGEKVEISGQGGWDRSTSKLHAALGDDINQAFDNIHYALLTEGGPGISSVYKLIIYLAPMTAESQSITVENLRKWFPDHRPLLTAIGVERFAFEGMRIEIEAWAHLPQKLQDQRRP